MIPFCKEGFDKTHINYGENDTIEIGVHSSINSPLRNSLSLLPFTVHAGYYPILVNFKEQIQLGQEKQVTNFHSVYLMKVLDGFAMEFIKWGKYKDPTKYQSRILTLGARAPIPSGYMLDTLEI